MSYFVSFGEGVFTLSKKSKLRQLTGQWSARFGNPYQEKSNPSQFTEYDGFYRLNKNRKLSLYLDNGDGLYDKKIDTLLSKTKLGREETKKMQNATSGSILLDYANWEFHPDTCSNQDYCWEEEFIYRLNSDSFNIIGSIKANLGHKLFNDFL